MSFRVSIYWPTYLANASAMSCADPPNRGNDAVARINREFPSAEVYYFELDLTDKKSIETFADEFNKTEFV